MELSIGNKIELINLDQIITNDPLKKVYVSKIYDILPDNVLQIAMPIYDGKIVPLSVDDRYSACFYTSRGLLQCNVLIKSRYKSDNLFFLDVLMLEDLSKVQRREYYRYKCSMETRYRIVSEKECETGEPDDPTVPKDLLEWNDARILDISGGGLRIVSKKHLNRNEFVEVKFMLMVVDEFILFDQYARVLDNSPYQGRNDVFEQRLEFLRISRDDRDKIVKYIFDNERMARAKETGLK